MNLATTMLFEAKIQQQDLSHQNFPNDLENQPRQVTRTVDHKHSHTTICVDFDGVIASYDGYRGRGWIGAPKPEGMELLHRLNQMGYYVVVLTARQELDLVGKWLQEHGVGFAVPTNTKPPAVAYIDDRAIEWKDDLSTVISKLKDLDNVKTRSPRSGA
jgi:hypothetical protein